MKTIRINTSTPYDVMIGSGLLANSGKLIADTLKGRKTVVVSDDTVYGLYGEKLESSLKNAGFTVFSFVFPHGEESKCHKTLIGLYDFLAEKNITRSDSLIALGGGVTGDLTGFAAATYLRGIDYVQVPTTLLAQVDSSVGGKTAVDISGGKNLVGAFKQPRLVIADTDTLDTLSDELFTDGMGEVVKYGMIFSEKLFETLETGKIKDNIEEIVSQCVDIKRFVVETDEFDTGLRMTLNFGHTIGHAIEKIQNYRGLSHGAAVSVGMYMMTRVAEKGGLIEDNISDRLKACLIRNNMPYEVDISGEELFKNSANDKKRFSDTINIIVCRKVGKADIVKMKLDEYEELLKYMDIKITPQALRGKINVPSSKSVSHRALICAALANGESVIHDLLDCEDTRATIDALTALGAEISFENGEARVKGISISENIAAKNAEINCRESGSTLRFMIPVAAALGAESVFYGSGKLPERPITPYFEEFEQHGAKFLTTAMPYRISGRLEAGEYKVRGDISSQFITGYMTALPLCGGESRITLTTELQSKPYADLTADVMKSFGVCVNEDKDGYIIPSGQKYTARDFTVEADMSQAAFFLVADAICGGVEPTNLREDSVQGDREIVNIVSGFKASGGKAFDVNARQIPDLVPILTVLACFADGVSHITGCERLRIKESDRLAAISDELNKLGAKVKAGNDYLEITGVSSLSGGVCDAHNDHRIAMSIAIASQRCTAPVTITGAQCVAKSYPNFFEDFRALGGIADVI